VARGASRVAVVTNGFDPADFSGLKSAGDDEMIITYLGTSYPGHQDLDTAVRAIGSLAREGALPRLRLRFVGKMPTGLREAIVESGLGDVVEATGFVSHEESLRHICRSTLLLHAGPTSVETNALRGIVPGKTFEYLGAGRPILFVGHPEGDAAKLLSALTSVKIVRPGDVEGARAAVLRLLEQGAPPRPCLLQRYTSRSVTGDLARVLDRARLGGGESAAGAPREKLASAESGPP
jgi:glycosyltransferase involved in cell wall biosynthesis